MRLGDAKRKIGPLAVLKGRRSSPHVLQAAASSYHGGSSRDEVLERKIERHLGRAAQQAGLPSNTAKPKHDFCNSC